MSGARAASSASMFFLPQSRGRREEEEVEEVDEVVDARATEVVSSAAATTLTALPAAVASTQIARARTRMLSHVEDGPSRPLRRPLRAGFEPIENTNAELFFSIDRFSDDFFYLSLFINLDPQSAKQDFSLPFSPCFEFIPFEPVSNLQSGAIPFERDPKGRNDPFSQFFFAPPSLTFSLIFGLAGDAAAAAAAAVNNRQPSYQASSLGG